MRNRKKSNKDNSTVHYRFNQLRNKVFEGTGRGLVEACLFTSGRATPARSRFSKVSRDQCSQPETWLVVQLVF